MPFYPKVYGAPVWRKTLASSAAGGYLATRYGPRPSAPTYAKNPGEAIISHRPYRKSNKKSFKQKMLKNIKAKHQVTSDNQTTSAIVHNNLYTCNLTAGIVQGTQDFQRIGDSCHLLALKVSAQFISAAAANQPVQFRILIGYSGEEYNVPNTLSSTSMTFTQVFQGGTGNTWANTGIVNPKAFTVLDDRTVTINNYIVGQSETQIVNYTVPCNMDFPYEGRASVFGKFKNLYMLVQGCIVGGTAGVTAVGNCGISTDLIFKDI